MGWGGGWPSSQLSVMASVTNGGAAVYRARSWSRWLKGLVIAAAGALVGIVSPQVCQQEVGTATLGVLVGAYSCASY